MAQEICHLLEDCNIKCLMAPRDIPAGSGYNSAVAQDIKECKAVVLLFSESSVFSRRVVDDLFAAAFFDYKPIVSYKIEPVAIEDDEESLCLFPMLYNGFCVESYSDFRAGFAELIKIVSNITIGKTYKVGDYYNENGKEGVVFEVSADGCHGKIVSMKHSVDELQWTSDESEWGRVLCADWEDNGAFNMGKVIAIPGWKEKYPAFAWCANLGYGWYLPAIKELEVFTLNDSVRKLVNQTLVSKEGAKIDDDDLGSYWSSTEVYHLDWVWRVPVYGSTLYDRKNYNYYVRAVSAF